MIKTQTRLGLSLLAVVGLMLFGILWLPTSASANPTPTTATPTEVTDYHELDSALMDSTVTDISITSNIAITAASGITTKENKTITLQSPNTLSIHSMSALDIKSDGTFNVTEGATLQVDGALLLRNGGTLNIAGGFSYAGFVQNTGVINITVRNVDALLAALALQGAVNITIDGDIALAADLTIPAGKTVTIPSGSTLTNAGTLTNTGTISTVVTDEATLLEALALPGTVNITIDGTVTTYASRVIPVNKTVHVPSGSTLTNRNILTNNGTLLIEVGGTLVNDSVFSSSGTLSNAGTLMSGMKTQLEIQKDSTLINTGKLTVDWNGTLDIEIGATLTNEINGAIVLETQAIVGNEGTLSNAGTITANGILRNGGVLNNSGAFSVLNGASFENYATVNNSGSIINASFSEFLNGITGVFNNESGGVLESKEKMDLTNQGMITNKDGGTIISSGSFDNRGILNNDGELNSRGSLFNRGTLTNNGKLDNEGTISTTGVFSNVGELINSGEITILSDTFTSSEFTNTASGEVYFGAATLNNWELNGVTPTGNAVTIPYHGADPADYSFSGTLSNLPIWFGSSFSFDATTPQLVQFADESYQPSTTIAASERAYPCAMQVRAPYGDGTLFLQPDSVFSVTVEKATLQYALPDSITVDYTGMASHQQAFPLTITGGVAAGDEVLLEVFGTATFPNANFGSYDNVALTLDSTLSLTGAAAQNYTVSAPTQTTFTVKGTINTPKALPNDSVNGYVLAQPEASATLQQIADSGVQAYYDSLVSSFGSTFTSIYPTADSMIQTIKQNLPQGYLYKLFDLSTAQAEAFVDESGKAYYRLMMPAMGGVTADLYGNLVHIDPTTGEVDTYKQVSANTVPQLGEFRVIDGIGMELVVSHTSPLAISYTVPTTPSTPSTSMPSTSTPSGSVSGSTSTPTIGPDTGDNGMTGMLVLISTLALGGIVLTVRMRKTK